MLLQVLVGTPAEGVLKKGDVLMRISQTDAKGLSHQMAADLFTNAGNQIQIVIKRQSAASASTGNASNIPSPKPVAISGGVPLQGMTSTSPVRSPETLVLNLPQSRSSTQPFCAASHQASSSAPLSPLSLTIQNQPYRTSPLIQPSAKVDVGPGSVQHLRMQADHITGVRDALPEPNTLQYKANEFAMKQKVTGTLQHIQQTPFAPSISPPLTEPIAATSSPVPQPMSSPPVRPPKQYYNNPINLYSSENVAEIVRLNKMGVSGAPREVFPASPSSPTGLVNPNNPHQVVLTPSKEYNPKFSATWQALQESDAGIDPEKIRTYSSLREHDPVYSEIYAAPKQPQFAPYHKPNSPQPVLNRNMSNYSDTNSYFERSLQPVHSPAHSPAAMSSHRSPVAEFLPPNMRSKLPEDDKQPERSSEEQQSAVLMAALAYDDSRPRSSSSFHQDHDRLPLYETSSIGGRKRIPQSASFNRLMMEVFGE